MDIDKEFVDVDFPSQPQYVFGAGGVRSLDNTHASGDGEMRFTGALEVSYT